jgi:transposase
MPEKRRKFHPEFREAVVRIVRETAMSVARITRDLGIDKGTLGNWTARDGVERGEAEGLTRDEHDKLTQLRREVAELRMKCVPSEGRPSDSRADGVTGQLD